MEALTGVSVALLTVYDMCKAVDKRMVLSEIRLLEKHGGKSGDLCFEGGAMKDQFARTINYIRFSITDRCNLRCTYCMPNGVALERHEDLLSYEEFLKRP